MLSQLTQRTIQSKAELDGEHPGGAVLGQVCEGLEGLLEERRWRLAGRGTLGSAGAGLLAVGDSLVPYLASQGVMGQAFYLLVPPVAGQRFLSAWTIRAASGAAPGGGSDTPPPGSAHA